MRKTSALILIVLIGLVSSAHAFVLAGIIGNRHIATAPNAPTSVTATPSNAQNYVSWVNSAVDSTHDAATSYDLLWGTSSGNESNTITGATSPYTHTSLTNTQAYYYKVRAVNATGNATSSEVSATPVVFPTGSWTALTAGGGTVTTNGDGTVTINDAGTSGVAALDYLTSAVTLAQSKTYKMKFQILSNLGGVCIGLARAQPVTGTVATVTGSGAWWERGNSIAAWTDGTSTYLRAIAGSSSGTQVWSQRTGGWVVGGSIQWSTDGKYQVSLNTTYTGIITTTTTGYSFALKSADEGTVIFQTTELPWSGWFASPPATGYLFNGDMYTDNGYGAYTKLISWSAN